MNASPIETQQDVRHERQTRIRVGATGLAFIVLVVLLAATFSGTASNEPELTPEAMAEDAASETAEAEVPAEPQEPLAEIGVMPTTTPEAEPSGQQGGVEAAPDPE